jgi:hypothetical protein
MSVALASKLFYAALITLALIALLIVLDNNDDWPDGTA